jgi:hypothetical protein
MMDYDKEIINLAEQIFGAPQLKSDPPSCLLLVQPKPDPWPIRGFLRAVKLIG